MGMDERMILKSLDGTRAKVVMGSGYNHLHVYDPPTERGYDVRVAHTLSRTSEATNR